MSLSSTKTLSFTTSEAGAKFVSVISSNSDVVFVKGSQITALTQGESIITFSYETNGYLYEISFTVKVVNKVVLTET